MKQIRIYLALAAAALFLAVDGRAASISVYLSAPGSEVSGFNGALVETFDSLATGNRTTDYVSTIGTYALSGNSTFNIQAANQYNGVGGSRYMTFGAQSGTSTPVTLNLNNNYQYFGFFWGAGDVNNGLSFYNGNTLLASYSTADIITLLSPKSGQVTALNGNLYNNSLYYGNPDPGFSGQNSNEPYAFISFVLNGATFNRIVFNNNNSTGTGFETDNHTVLLTAPVIPQTSVLVRNVPAVPEPSTIVLCGAGLALAAISRLRRR